MELRFEVGQQERHEVVYSWDQMWGWLTVTVDGRQVYRALRMFALSLTWSREIVVGESEKHRVRLRKDRALVVSGLRGQVMTAYVDNVPVAQETARLSAGQGIALAIVGVIVVAAVLVCWMTIPAFRHPDRTGQPWISFAPLILLVLLFVVGATVNAIVGLRLRNRG